MIKEIIFAPSEYDECKLFAAIDKAGRIGLFKNDNSMSLR
jgi:hypothetical protein